ncbi:hypothetical protein [Rhodoplanes azumiensis]|uniref:IrrE N-terminal-like domain-containing protein n=1 Tax=Rhodoplanes azumiensis TaxID=1897628 RepID=A0ABW5AJI0_9BRAD
MARSLRIIADWEPLDSGPPEERACFAALGIYAQNVCLTEGSDLLANRLRQAPLLSSYHLAEWMAWNWWRLRWEPRSKSSDWVYAHRVATIGGGYIWPNLTIFSDGQRTTLVAEPTRDRPQTPFRYITDDAAVVPSSEFESELDLFVEQVLERLKWAGVGDSNLETVWKGVLSERRTPALATVRKLEALLGRDPGESDPASVERLVLDAERLSISAIEELAAEHGHGGAILNADELDELAAEKGYEASRQDMAHLPRKHQLPRPGEVAAWQLGARAAAMLREEERISEEPITDRQLAQMAGVQVAALADRAGASAISFVLDENADRGRVVLRSKWHEGRRFELARLLGDRILSSAGERLFPATRAYTYRQKTQRSFAAELLSPFDAVDAMLGDDYSLERQKDVAEHFQVSELTIRTLLVNHGRLGREELDGEFEGAAA